ncbi:MAG TPA: hypothetical protein VHY79_16630 [Rhizomicrobium sp.]|nr:hypothetical protein [Rhizomicrobium sp.]
MSIVVRGTLSDSRHIELDSPVTGISGEIEVTIRKPAPGGRASIFDLIEELPAGLKTKSDIDAQLEEDRRQWLRP